MSATKFLSILNSTNSKIISGNYSYSQFFQFFQKRNYRAPGQTINIKQTYGPKGFKGNKHWDPKFAHMRRMKVLKLDLSEVPDYETQRENKKTSEMGPEAMRSYLKKQGIPPTRPYRDRGRDRPIHVSSTSGILEEYVPPEGDGKASRLSREGVAQAWDQLSSKSRELFKHARTIKRLDEEFDPKTFGEMVAMPIFINAHQTLMEREKERLHELVTEHAFSVMYDENRLRSIRWELIESIEPARVVHVRATGVLHDDNIFGQVTVRMHTKQKLAVYDQFGRLFLGSNDVARDVLEYVVFERHLVDPYGVWRLHAKITPKWLPPKDAVIRTFRRQEKKKKHEVADDVKSNDFVPIKDESEVEKPVVAKV